MRRKVLSAVSGNKPPPVEGSPPPVEENTDSLFISDPVDLPEAPEVPQSAQQLPSIVLSSGGVSDPIDSPTPQSNTGQPEVEPYVTCRW